MNFVGKSEKTMFFVAGKQQETILNFSLDSLIASRYDNKKKWKIKKILNLLNEVNDSKFVTTKRNIVNNQSKSNYGAGNEIIYKTEVLKSNLCD